MITTLLILAMGAQSPAPTTVQGTLGTIRVEVRGGPRPGGFIDYGQGLRATWQLPEVARIERTVARPDRWEVMGTWEGGRWHMTLTPGRVARSVNVHHRVTFSALGVSRGWQEGWRIAGASAPAQPTFSSDPLFWTAGVSGQDGVHGWMRPNLPQWDAASARTLGISGLGVVQLPGSRREREARWSYDLKLDNRPVDWTSVSQGWETDVLRFTQTNPGLQKVPFEQVANTAYTTDYSIYHSPAPVWSEGTTVTGGWWQRESEMGPIGAPNQPELEFGTERNAAQAAYGMWVWAQALRRFTWQQNAERVLRLAFTAEGRMGGIYTPTGWRQGDEADARETRFWLARALRRGAFQGAAPADQAKMMPAFFRLVDQAIEARDFATLSEVERSGLPEELISRAREALNTGLPESEASRGTDPMDLIQAARLEEVRARHGGTRIQLQLRRLLQHQFTVASPYRVTVAAQGAFFARSTPTLQGRALAILHDRLLRTGEQGVASRLVLGLRWQSATLRTNIDPAEADRPSLPEFRLTSLASHGPMDSARLSQRWEDAAASAAGLADTYQDFGSAVVLRFAPMSPGNKETAPVPPAEIIDTRPNDVHIGIDGVGYGSPSRVPGVALLARTFPSYGRSYVTMIRNGGAARMVTPQVPGRVTRLSARQSGKNLTVFGFLSGILPSSSLPLSLTLTPDGGAALTRPARRGLAGPEVTLPINPRWNTIRLSSNLGPDRLIDMRPGLPLDRPGAWIGGGQLLEAVQLEGGRPVVTTGSANWAGMQGVAFSRPFLTGNGALTFRYQLNPDPRVRLDPQTMDSLSIRVQDADSGEVWTRITRQDLTKGQTSFRVPAERLGVVVLEDRTASAGLTLTAWGPDTR